MDRLIIGFDRALRTLSGDAAGTNEVPGAEFIDDLTEAQRRHVSGLMRVNHSGEVCAQALYLGQALLARNEAVARALRVSADEEVEHLAWTLFRLNELGGSPSCLVPLWFFGAFVIGVTAAAVGDRTSLSFLHETERQVVDHLNRQLARLPEIDRKSRAIILRMRDDEAHHARVAENLGGAGMAPLARTAMRQAARVMTGASYWF